MARNHPNRVFNIKKRWLRRAHIPLVEIVSSALVAMTMALSGLWFFKQKDNFDPRERDLDPSLLAQTKTRELYVRPVKYWREPDSINGESQGPNIAPFPASLVDDDEWQVSGRVRHFQADNLFEKINGEAPKFLKQNFRELHYLVLQARTDGSEIAIELFDHQNLKSSIGIFSAHFTGDNKVLNAGAVNYFTTGAGVIGRKGRFFFRVTTTALNEQSTAKIRQLVEDFSALEESADELPFEYRVLNEQLGIPGGAIAYVAKNAFQYDFASDFWFGTHPGADSERFFIHDAKDSEQARELYHKLLAELEFDYELQAADEGRGSLLKHRFLDSSWFILRYSGRYLYGVDRLADPGQAETALKTLSERIRGKNG